MCSSEHNRGGVERHADESHRVHEILEIRQNGRRHLGRHFYRRSPFRCRVWIIGRCAALHREITRPRGATLHMQARSSARH